MKSVLEANGNKLKPNSKNHCLRYSWRGFWLGSSNLNSLKLLRIVVINSLSVVVASEVGKYVMPTTQ